MAGHSGPGSSTSQTQSSQIQTNVIKTMILVSTFYIITWIPGYTHYLILHFKSDCTKSNIAHFMPCFVDFSTSD